MDLPTSRHSVSPESRVSDWLRNNSTRERPERAGPRGMSLVMYLGKYQREQILKNPWDDSLYVLHSPFIGFVELWTWSLNILIDQLATLSYLNQVDGPRKFLQSQRFGLVFLPSCFHISFLLPEIVWGERTDDDGLTLLLKSNKSQFLQMFKFKLQIKGTQTRNFHFPITHHYTNLKYDNFEIIPMSSS